MFEETVHSAGAKAFQGAHAFQGRQNVKDEDVT